VTRMDSVRTATESTRDGVRHAAEAVAPYAESARDTAVHYAHEAGARLGPKVSQAARQARSSAREGYGQYVVPRIHEARKSLPPEWDRAATKAAKRTRKAARKAGEYAAPRIEQAVAEARAAATPAYEEATGRGNAALAALRSGVPAKEIEKLARRRDRRARCGKLTKRLGLFGLLAAGAYAAWRWWDKQANPDWLVEPPAATEVGDRTTMASAHVGPAPSGTPQAAPGTPDTADALKTADASEASGSPDAADASTASTASTAAGRAQGGEAAQSGKGRSGGKGGTGKDGTGKSKR
jgi:hypothetical protein